MPHPTMILTPFVKSAAASDPAGCASVTIVISGDQGPNTVSDGRSNLEWSASAYMLDERRIMVP